MARQAKRGQEKVREGKRVHNGDRCANLPDAMGSPRDKHRLPANNFTPPPTRGVDRGEWR
jgi:hypothetical protein